MASPLQATTPGAPAAVPSQTQTGYDPRFAQTQTNSDRLLAQTGTGSSPLVARAEASSGPLLSQAQMPASAVHVPAQFQPDYGEQSVQVEVSYMYMYMYMYMYLCWVSTRKVRLPKVPLPPLGEAVRLSFRNWTVRSRWGRRRKEYEK